MADPVDPKQMIPAFALPRIEPMNLTGFPMPPTSNNMYRTGRLHSGKIGRFKSADTRRWEADVANWALKHSADLIRIRGWIRSEVTLGKVLDVHTRFWFHRSKIVSKKGTPKRLDTTNRIKGVHDILARLLEVDDSYFWHGSFEKLAFDEPLDHPGFVDILIGSAPLQTLNLR